MDIKKLSLIKFYKFIKNEFENHIIFEGRY